MVIPINKQGGRQRALDHAQPRPRRIDKRVRENSSPISEMRRSEVGSQFRVKATSPGQIRQPSSNEVALVVFLNEHRMPRALGALSAQPGRESRAAVSRV